jgi:hypothetical protein
MITWKGWGIASVLLVVLALGSAAFATDYVGYAGLANPITAGALVVAALVNAALGWSKNAPLAGDHRGLQRWADDDAHGVAYHSLANLRMELWSLVMLVGSVVAIAMFASR